MGQELERKLPNSPHSHWHFSLNFKLERITNAHILLSFTGDSVYSDWSRVKRESPIFSVTPTPEQTFLYVSCSVVERQSWSWLNHIDSNFILSLLDFLKYILFTLYSQYSFQDFNVNSSSVTLVSPEVGPWSSSHHPRCKGKLHPPLRCFLSVKQRCFFSIVSSRRAV